MWTTSLLSRGGVTGLAGALLSLCLCAACLLPPFARTARAQQSQAILQDFPILFPRFKQKGLKADYVIVIDRSGSMSKYWETVVAGLREFVDAVQDGDRVSVVTFANESTASQNLGCYRDVPIPTRVIDSQEARETLKKDIGDICTPDGSDTDIGEALEKALGALNVPGGNPLKIVFFFTDFIHLPSDKSPYYGMRQGTETVWKNLETQRKNEQTGKTIYSYALLLENGANTGRDLHLARAVLSDVEPIRLNSNTLRAHMTLIRDSLLRDRLKAVVNSEAARSEVTLAELKRRENELVAVFEFKRGDLLTTKSISEVEISDLDAGSLGSRLILTDHKGKEYPVDADSGRVEVPVANINDSDSLLDRFLAWEMIAPTTLTLKGRRTFEPVAEVTKLNLPKEVYDFRAEGTSALHLSGGLIGLITLLVLVALALLLFLLLRRKYRKRFIIGTFIVRDARQEEMGRAAFKEANRQSDFLVGNLSAKDDGNIPVPGADWLLHFYYVSPRPLDNRRGLYLRVKEGEAQVSMNGVALPLSGGYTPTRLGGGAIITAGQHTVTYEPFSA